MATCFRADSPEIGEKLEIRAEAGGGLAVILPSTPAPAARSPIRTVRSRSEQSVLRIEARAPDQATNKEERDMRNRIETNLGRYATALAMAVTIAAAGSALAAVSPEQKCEAGKVDAAGKYAACLAKAEKGLVLKTDLTKYNAAVAKCGSKMESTFAKLETAAEKKDADCPSVDDFEPVEEFVAECVEGVAVAVAGGELPSCDGGGGGGLPATGQTECRDDVGTVIPCAGTGQDGEVQAGVARSFTDNGDGTITDHATGLMWEKNTDDDSIHDKDTVFTFSGAQGKVATLNTDGFAGYDDWRVPNVIELMTLLDFSATTNPRVFPEFNDSCVAACDLASCSCTRASEYWSSSYHPSNLTWGWSVRMDTWNPAQNPKAAAFPVRAVRGGL
jgi:hypothetical protein